MASSQFPDSPSPLSTSGVPARKTQSSRPGLVSAMKQYHDSTAYNDQENLEQWDLLMPSWHDGEATCAFLSDSTNIVAATASEIEGMHDMTDCPDHAEPHEPHEPAEPALQTNEETEGVLREAMDEESNSSFEEIGGEEKTTPVEDVKHAKAEEKEVGGEEQTPPVEDGKQAEAEETALTKEEMPSRPLRVWYVAPENIRDRFKADIESEQAAGGLEFCQTLRQGGKLERETIAVCKGVELHECVGITGKFRWFRTSEVTVKFKDGQSEKFEYRVISGPIFKPLKESWDRPDFAVFYVPEDETFQQRRLRLNISFVMDYYRVPVLEITQGSVNVNKQSYIPRQRICENESPRLTKGYILRAITSHVEWRQVGSPCRIFSDFIGLFCGHFQQKIAGYCDENTHKFFTGLFHSCLFILLFLSLFMAVHTWLDPTPNPNLLRDWQVPQSLYPVQPLMPKTKDIADQNAAMRACVADQASLDMRTILNLQSQLEHQEKKEQLSGEGYFEARVASPCHAILKIPVLSVPRRPNSSNLQFKTKALVNDNEIRYDMTVLSRGYALLRFPPDQLNDGIVSLNIKHHWAKKEERIRLDFNQETSLKLRAQAAQFQQTLRSLEDRVAELNAKLWTSAKDIAHDFRHVAQEETSFWSNASSLVFDRAIEEAGLLRKKFHELNFTRNHMGRAAKKLQTRRAELLAELRKQRASSRGEKLGLGKGAKNVVQEMWLRVNPFQGLL